ncbi:MAG: OB-fold nucleic acid binding domain-containing protein, partial [Lachnospiraceae bacterium]
NLTGQMSLFDLVEEEDREGLTLKLPNVGEYPKEMKLAFEKEVLGVYVSGHPLEEYQKIWQKKITNTTADFAFDEEVGAVRVKDGAPATIGGLIAGKTVKYTKNNKVMAFLTIEDLVGSVEVVVFPKDYEKNANYLTEDAKVFVQGRISVEEDKDGKLICEKMIPFATLPKKVWIKFPDMDAFKAAENSLFDALKDSEGKDSIVIYIENPKAMKELPRNMNVEADEVFLNRLRELFGKENVSVTIS